MEKTFAAERDLVGRPGQNCRLLSCSENRFVIMVKIWFVSKDWIFKTLGHEPRPYAMMDVLWMCFNIGKNEVLSLIEIRLECTCPKKCFLIWNYYIACLWAPLLILTHSKETVFDQNKNKILAILFKYEKITLYWWVFSVVGAHNQQFFACSNEGKN